MVERAVADFPTDSSLGVNMDILKINTLKTHTDPQTVRGRPTLSSGFGSEQVGPRTRFIMGSLFVNYIMYRFLCFMETVLQRLVSYTVISHTTVHAVRGRPVLNHIERSRNRSSIHEFNSFKANQMCKVHTCFVSVFNTGGERSSKTLDTKPE